MKNENGINRKKEILEAALDVFSIKGYSEATLDEIAQKVKITKPALYLYFKNKESLFYSMISEKMEIIRKNFEEISGKYDKSIDKLKAVIGSHIGFYKENVKFFKVIHRVKMNMEDKGKSNFKKDFMNHYKDHVLRVTMLMKDLIKDGYIRNEDPFFLSLSLMGILNQSVFGSMLGEKKSFFNQLENKVLKLFLEGAGK